MNDNNARKVAPYTHNIDIKSGWLVQDAEFFLTRSNNYKITFRIAVPRDANKPSKSHDNVGNTDLIYVVAYGNRFKSMLSQLRQGTKVLVQGWTQSRDVITNDGGRRIAIETVADTIAILDQPPAEVGKEKTL